MKSYKLMYEDLAGNQVLVRKLTGRSAGYVSVKHVAEDGRTVDSYGLKEGMLNEYAIKQHWVKK